ncbi:MAG: hypothetical protein K6G06_00835 [Butyrivibrio sp.]|nr:hypothetical protein [Butyrivibrio sp.]
MFAYIFGHPGNKKWALGLYNAMNGSDYKDEIGLEINTVNGTLHIEMYNDASYIISDITNIFEIQENPSPNSTLRRLKHLGKIRREYLLNIADDESNLLLQTRPLEEYAWLINRIRENCKKFKVEAAADMAIEFMPKDFEIKGFLSEQKAEIVRILSRKYADQQPTEIFNVDSLREGRERGFEEGLEAGIAQGIEQGIERINQLNAKLIRAGRLNDLKKASRNIEYQRVLIRELIEKHTRRTASSAPKRGR